MYPDCTRQSPNKTLHWTAIPLRSIAAGALWHYAEILSRSNFSKIKT